MSGLGLVSFSGRILLHGVRYCFLKQVPFAVDTYRIYLWLSFYSKNILIVAIDTFYFPLACMQAIYSFFRNQSLQAEKLCIEMLSVAVKINSFNFLKLKKKKFKFTVFYPVTCNPSLNTVH